MKRCGSCKNCLELEMIQRLVLACCSSAIDVELVRQGIKKTVPHADDGVVLVWNKEVARLPCLNGEEGSKC